MIEQSAARGLAFELRDLGILADGRGHDRSRRAQEAAVDGTEPFGTPPGDGEAAIDDAVDDQGAAPRAVIAILRERPHGPESDAGGIVFSATGTVCQEIEPGGFR